MSLRRADPRARVAALRSGNARHPVGTDGPTGTDGGTDDPIASARRLRVVLLAPVIISLLVQVPAAIGIAVWLRVGWAAGLAQVALAAIGPLALLASRRYPGPDGRRRRGRRPRRPPAHPRRRAALRRARLRDRARRRARRDAVGRRSPWSSRGWRRSCSAPWSASTGIRSASRSTTALLAACFGIGAFVRVRRERAAEFRAEAMRRRQTAEQRERVRIARELHDVIGHALSQINVQASVGLHLMDRDPEQARSALASHQGDVEDGARGGAQRARRHPQRGRCPARAAGRARRAARGSSRACARRASTPSSSTGSTAPCRAGRRSSPPTASRRRPSPTSCGTPVRRRAVVAVERLGDELLVTVDDDGAGVRGSPEGSGILGMRERAALLGGSVEVSASPRGGTRVTARLPWGATP